MKFLRHTEVILLIALSIAAIVVSVADYTGLLKRMHWDLAPEYNAMLLVLFGAIGLHLATSRLLDERFRESFEGGSDRLIKAFDQRAEALLGKVRGADVRAFANAAEQEHYLAKRLGEAHIEICDLSWKDTLSLHVALPDRVKSHKSYENSIAKAAKRIPYREVFVFSDPRRVEKLQRRIEEDLPGYSCRYFQPSSPIPRLQFIMIDREEIVFASSSYPKLCAIRQPELAQIFQAYYESIWAVAIPLKDGRKVHHEEVKKVVSKSTNYPEAVI